MGFISPSFQSFYLPAHSSSLNPAPVGHSTHSHVGVCQGRREALRRQNPSPQPLKWTLLLPSNRMRQKTDNWTNVLDSALETGNTQTNRPAHSWPRGKPRSAVLSNTSIPFQLNPISHTQFQLKLHRCQPSGAEVSPERWSKGTQNMHRSH